MKAKPRVHLKLAVELVPAPLWNRTLAQLARAPSGRTIWTKIREVELKRTGKVCEVCGQRASHVHEKWDYDDERLIQRLRGFEVLCQECHLVHHQGFAGVHGLTNLAMKRFAEVNSVAPAMAKSIVKEAFDVWGARSVRGPWTQNFEWLVANAGKYDLGADLVEEAVRFPEEPEGADEGSELWGVPTIGSVRADILGDLGIRTIEQLASSDPGSLLAASSAARIRDASFPSQMPMAVNYARAISQRKPIVTTHPRQLSKLDESRILFVDLEYDPEEAFIFIIGAMTMDGKMQQHFVEKSADLPRFLLPFLDRVRDNDLQCVSYGSTSADVPMLRRAIQNVGMSRSRVDDLPFLDLFRDVIFTQNLRKQWLYLPLKPMDAKSVARYFGYDPPKNVTIRDGFEALMQFKGYLRSRSRATRGRLLRYNASDLKLTRRVFEELRNLETGRGDTQTYRLA